MQSPPTIRVDKSGRSRDQNGLWNATSEREFGSVGEAARADLKSGEVGRVLDSELVAVAHGPVLQNQRAEAGEVGGGEVPEIGECTLTEGQVGERRYICASGLARTQTLQHKLGGKLRSAISERELLQLFHVYASHGGRVTHRTGGSGTGAGTRRRR